MPAFVHHTLLTLVLVCTYAASIGHAQNRFTQLVFSFPNERTFTHQYNKQDNTLTIELLNTTPSELNALDHYDETLIKRILVKDLSPRGTEVTLVLRDRNIRASIDQQEEPYRIIVDLFDNGYNQPRDPETGLPLATAQQQQEGPANFDAPALADEANTPSIHAPQQRDGTRKLLQPTPAIISTASEMRDAMNQLEPGIGKKWKEFPVYIYRLQTASYIGAKEESAMNKKQLEQAMNSSQAMADYAGKLYDFGHENRALIAYQQVLHKQPKIFDDSALHLWKFAESHLGQGNITLADGYYEALVHKHPQSELSEFAKLRRLDVQALNANTAGDPKKFSAIDDGLNTINSRNNRELAAQINIRRAFWRSYSTSDKSVLTQRDFIPLVKEPLLQQMRDSGKSAEGQRTAFLSYTLALNSLLEPTNPWTTDTGSYASEYLDRFSGTATEPFKSSIKAKLLSKLIVHFTKALQEQQYVEIIRDYESLSKAIENEAVTHSGVAWAVAEAYRKTGQSEKSIRFYDLAAKSSENKSDQFRANFWLAVVTGDTRQQLKGNAQNPAKIALLGDLARAADRNMEVIWADLDEKSRQELNIALKDPFEKTLDSEAILKTPALAILSSYDQKLGTKVSASTADTTNIKENSSPLASTVVILSKLAKRFTELAMPKERLQALALLKNIKPANIQNDDSAKKLWAKELLGLAEEYRQQNNSLEAGRLYSFTGDHAQDFANRAEALYKGGLLLYRSGRKEEAVTAFKSCSEDGNNRYYANLCLERLDKLNNQ